MPSRETKQTHLVISLQLRLEDTATFSCLFTRLFICLKRSKSKNVSMERSAESEFDEWCHTTHTRHPVRPRSYVDISE